MLLSYGRRAGPRCPSRYALGGPGTPNPVPVPDNGTNPALSAWESGVSDHRHALGIRPIGASDRLELGSRCTVSDRDGPYETAVNGPPMAHGARPLIWRL